MMRLAVIGDIHKSWDAEDTDFFNSADYAAILIVGDLPGRTNSGWSRVVQLLSRLRRPAFLIPGNHDGVSVMQKLAELKQDQDWIQSSSTGQRARCAEMERDIAPVQLCGYSIHTIVAGEEALDLVAARPHSMGGPTLAYAPYLAQQFGVHSIEESAQRIVELLEQCRRDALILAHNGPSGLGDRAEDIWGCDFRPEQGDFGDPDLELAIQRRPSGLRLLGVAAGHMHLGLRGKRGLRTSAVFKEGLCYLNAARVPRIYRDEAGRICRHHLHLEIDNGQLHAFEARVCGGVMELAALKANAAK
ncbi:MAG: metallophosphoesterase [Leptospirales bacterium]|nr:metallophosphoesterase [Leptospirales bacterium]